VVFRGLLFVFLLLLPLESAAQPTCALSEVIRERLRDISREAPQVQGIQVDGRLLEIWRNHDGSTWSVTITAFSNGKKFTCIMAHGTDFQPVIWFLEDGST